MDKIRYNDGVHDISNADYHSSSGVSRSALMDFRKSPFHYYCKYLAPQPASNEPSDAMLFGEMVHTLALEPDLFWERFVILPNTDRRTRAGKLEYSEFLVTKGIRHAIKGELIIEAQACADSLLSSDVSWSLIYEAKIEQSIYFTHAISGIQCKVRPDIWQSAVIGDVKTTADASYRAFQSSAYKFGYFLQAGMIGEALKTIGISMKKFVFLAVESKRPYAFGIYMLDEEAIDYGIHLFDNLMEKLARCKDSNKWESYGIQTLCVPNYAKFDMEFIE